MTEELTLTVIMCG